MRPLPYGGDRKPEGYGSVPVSSGAANGETSRVGRAGMPPRSVRLDLMKSVALEKGPYDWHEYAPSPRDGPLSFFRWLVVGFTNKSKETEEERKGRYRALARLLILLREYESRFGMPDGGGASEQRAVLAELCARLYGTGTPVWALQPVMARAAEGLTGDGGVEFLLLPRKGLIFSPATGSTRVFAMQSGFNIHQLNATERVLVRLASFASNTHSVSSVPTSFPEPEDLTEIMPAINTALDDRNCDREELSTEILDLASEGAGLFFFTSEALPNIAENNVLEFWAVTDSMRELFSRLAALEATSSIAQIDSGPTVLYPDFVMTLFRLGSSAGACAIWYGGSWPDLIVGGSLGILVAVVNSHLKTRPRQERIISEVVAAFVAGLTAGLIALRWPGRTCFGAMAVAGVVDILQGFRVVCSMMELMSKQTVSGGANFLEAILYTGLIAYFLRFGQYVAADIMGNPESIQFSKCTEGISASWYVIFVPIAAISWSGLFRPDYNDLFWMGMHGVLSYLVHFAVDVAYGNEYWSNFIAATSVTASAAIFSRFTGRQALGNTVAGLYVLLPGAYMVNTLMTNNLSQTGDYVQSIIVKAVTIGLGAWTGTLLCSPTVLGTNQGLLQQSSQGKASQRRTQNAMLYF